jgi:hypothetical protein
MVKCHPRILIQKKRSRINMCSGMVFFTVLANILAGTYAILRFAIQPHLKRMHENTIESIHAKYSYPKRDRKIKITKSKVTRKGVE